MAENQRVNELDLTTARKSFPLDQGGWEKLDLYLNELDRWNRAKSLTRIPEKDRISKLILPSLWLGRFCLGLPGLRVLDLGSGAGIPGIPISILCPDARMVLLDRSQKKIAFLKQVIRRLNLENVEPVCMDGREYANTAGVAHMPGAAGPFDRIFSRSTGPTEEVLELSSLLLNPGGVLILQKGGRQLQQMEEFNWENVRAEYGLKFLGSTRVAPGIPPTDATLWIFQSARPSARPTSKL
jgi:16S rRNA (guanine527-N7)-methyltransferase